jgi:hypothetical protein
MQIAIWPPPLSMTEGRWLVTPLIEVDWDWERTIVWLLSWWSWLNIPSGVLLWIVGSEVSAFGAGRSLGKTACYMMDGLKRANKRLFLM